MTQEMPEYGEKCNLSSVYSKTNIKINHLYNKYKKYSIKYSYFMS